jgi:hypothetical protein
LNSTDVLLSELNWKNWYLLEIYDFTNCLIERSAEIQNHYGVWIWVPWLEKISKFIVLSCKLDISFLSFQWTEFIQVLLTVIGRTMQHISSHPTIGQWLWLLIPLYEYCGRHIQKFQCKDSYLKDNKLIRNCSIQPIDKNEHHSIYFARFSWIFIRIFLLKSTLSK